MEGYLNDYMYTYIYMYICIHEKMSDFFKKVVDSLSNLQMVDSPKTYPHRIP